MRISRYLEKTVYQILYTTIRFGVPLVALIIVPLVMVVAADVINEPTPLRASVGTGLIKFQGKVLDLAGDLTLILSIIYATFPVVLMSFEAFRLRIEKPSRNLRISIDLVEPNIAVHTLHIIKRSLALIGIIAFVLFGDRLTSRLQYGHILEEILVFIGIITLSLICLGIIRAIFNDLGLGVWRRSLAQLADLAGLKR